MVHRLTLLVLFSFILMMIPAASAQTGSEIALDRTNYPEFKIFQRDRSNQFGFELSGTASTSCSRVEASFNGGAFSIIDASPSAGTFSGTLANQPVGQGDLIVRCVDSAETDVAPNIGIGDVYVIAGQSNAEGNGTNKQLYTTIASSSAPFPTVYTEGDEWKIGNDETDIDGDKGSAWPILGGYIVENSGIPVAFITTAESAVTLFNKQADWTKGSSSTNCGNVNNGNISCYANMIAQVTEANTGGIKAVLWYQGESDLGAGSYKAPFEQFVSDVNRDLPGNPVVIPQTLGPMLNFTHESLTHIRLDVIGTWDQNPNVLYGPHGYDVHLTDDPDNADHIHFREDDELQTQGYRWWKALEAHFYGGSANGGRGPIINAAHMINGANEIHVDFSSNSALDQSTGTSTAAWELLDNGNKINVTAAAVIDHDTVRLTLDSVPTSNNVTISYAQHNSAENEDVIMDSSTGNVGLGPSGLPADPFLEFPVSRTATAGNNPPPNTDECIIPPSGPWPPCATGGNPSPAPTPQPDPTGECVIPPSGPWPPCATGGNTPPPTPDTDECVIPPSGPWPPCATGGR